MDEIFEINFESKWKQLVTKGSSEIAFVMLNIFWSWIKNFFTPPPILPILNGQYKTVWNANHKFWKGSSVKTYEIHLPVFLFLVLHLSYQQISVLHFCRISKIIWKKFFLKISFFNGFTSPPNHSHKIAKTCLTYQKNFCPFSIKCLLKHFFSKDLLTKSCKAFF